MGRSKIPITWIKSDASRQVTFNKRKKGMKKKAEELAILCGVDVCMICYGPSIVGGTNSSSSNKQPSQSPLKQQNQSSSAASASSSVPFSWGMPGVSSVITKFEGLPREERDKKKLDNTSLLEQQIKKLRRELKAKLDANWKLEQERAMLAWDDRLDCYSIDELKRLADCLLDKLRATFERISCWEHSGGGEDELVAAAGAAAATGDPGGGALVPSGSQSFLPYLSVNSMLLPPLPPPQPLGDGTPPPPPPANESAVFAQPAFYDTGFLPPPPPQLLWSGNGVVPEFNGCRLSRNFVEIGGGGDESWASPVGAEMSSGDAGGEPQEDEQQCQIAFRGYDV